MVKNPPCKQYEGPHITYHRNKKTFCRRKTSFSKKKKKKTPPCHQYPGKHHIYVRNGKSYCRKARKNNLSLLNKKTSKTDVVNNCLKLSHQKVKKYADLLNIDSREENNSELCLKITKILNNDSRKILTTNIYYQTTPEDVKHVSQLLSIPLINSNGKSKTMEELFMDICQKMNKYSSKTVKSLIQDLYQQKVVCSVETGYIFTKIIKNILYPNKFPEKSPMMISKDLNNRLLSLKKMKLLSNTTEQDLLRETLHSKLCHCIKGMLIKNKFRKDVLNKDSKYNPYAICTQSVYKNRGLRVPKKTVRKCPVDFDWYRKLDYITGKKKKSNSSKSKKKISIHRGGNVNENCQQSLEQVEMMKWPHIYANGNGWKGSGWA